MSCDGKSANSFFFSGDLCRAPGGRLGLISSAPNSAATTPDPGGFGFMDEIGGSIDGFVSCTESLGFESSDERSTDDGSSIEGLEGGRGARVVDSTEGRRARERSAEKRRKVEFPPPLTSLNNHGQRSFVFQPVRRDGRLELKEVKIRRPEVLFASRENGRLTLRFVRDLDEVEEEEEEELAGDDLKVEDEGELKVEEEEEKKEGGGGGDGGGCRSPVSGGEEEEALRRCYDYEVARHQRLQVWSPRCVTTR